MPGVEIQVAIIGAIFASFGYMAKIVVDWEKNRRKERARTIARLQRLQFLLDAAAATFDIQQDQVKRLMNNLKVNHPGEYNDEEGYDDAMSRCYRALNAQEREIHSIIRAYTQYSMRKVNLEISEWLKADDVFKTAVVKSKRRRELANNLFALETHLLLWHAKYEAWIPNHPDHALVYMTDEKNHGLGFPGDRACQRSTSEGGPAEQEKFEIQGIDKDVAGVLEELLGSKPNTGMHRYSARHH